MLEGDNAYYCEKCDKKIDTLKRECIKKLPNVLIVVLKRFNFNLQTFMREKLNDYFSYPDDLDLSEYCQENLAKQELFEKMQKKNLVYDQLNEHEKEIHDFELPPAYYQYDLKGTVVHHGTADAGHYYSYIQERDG